MLARGTGAGNGGRRWYGGASGNGSGSEETRRHGGDGGGGGGGGGNNESRIKPEVLKISWKEMLVHDLLDALSWVDSIQTNPESNLK